MDEKPFNQADLMLAYWIWITRGIKYQKYIIHSTYIY